MKCKPKVSDFCWLIMWVFMCMPRGGGFSGESNPDSSQMWLCFKSFEGSWHRRRQDEIGGDTVFEKNENP